MTVCPYEQRYGRPCHLCRHPKQESRPDHAPTHPDHLALVEAIDRIATAQLYAERRLYLLAMEIGGLTGGERAALDAWAAGQAPLPAGFVVRAHCAGPVVLTETPLQACTRCHLVLQDQAAIVEDGAYPVGAFVGLDCDGVPASAEGGQR